MTSTNNSTIRLEITGRRIYFLGNTYPAKDRIRSIGAKWDSEKRAWWIGSTKRSQAEELIGSLSADSRDDAPGLDARIIGRAEYKGRSYYVASRYGEPVRSGNGRTLLYATDGSFQFWAAELQHLRLYRAETSIRANREFAEQAKSGLSSCAECGFRTADLVDAKDASGGVAPCCRRCAAMPAHQRSFG